MLDVSQRLKLLPTRNALRLITAPTVGASRQAMYIKAFARLGRRRKQAQPERISLGPLSPVERIARPNIDVGRLVCNTPPQNRRHLR